MDYGSLSCLWVTLFSSSFYDDAFLGLCWAFMGIKNVYSRVLGGFTLDFTARASAPQFSPCLPLRHWVEQLSDTSAHGCWTVLRCLVFKQFYKHFSDLMHPQIQSLLSASVSALRAGWISVQGITTGFNIMPFPSEELLEDTSLCPLHPHLRKTSKQSGEVRILLSLALVNRAWLRHGYGCPDFYVFSLHNKYVFLMPKVCFTIPYELAMTYESCVNYHVRVFYPRWTVFPLEFWSDFSSLFSVGFLNILERPL